MRGWWNWYTHTVEGRGSLSMRVQVPPRAQRVERASAGSEQISLLASRLEKRRHVARRDEHDSRARAGATYYFQSEANENSEVS